MKKILPILLFITTAAHSQTILIGAFGESNWVSRAKPDSRYEVPTTPGAMWYKQSTNTLEPVTDPIGEGISTADNRSAGPALAKRLKELMPGYNVIIVPAAAGGTTIGGWSKGGTLHARAKSMWDAAIAYCAANNITITKKYVAWEQGGNDVVEIETDGYYVLLNKLVNDFVSDFGAEKVFGIRIGYDPNYAPASEVEKIMKAHKLVGFNNPNYIMATNEPAAFTISNGKMQGDLAHWTLLGINETANSLGEAIHLYQATGTKPSLSEPVIPLQSVTTGDINLNPDWNFELNNNLLETNANATAHNRTMPAFTYNSGALVFNGVGGVKISRPFVSDVFTIEIRVKVLASKTNNLFGSGQGGGTNNSSLVRNGNNSYLLFNVGGTGYFIPTDDINWDSFHTIVFQQAGGFIKIYIDGVQRGGNLPSSNAITFQYIGTGEYYITDLEGEVDYFKTSVGNIVLPIGFTSLNARCVSGSVQLNWSAPYQNYTVQKSADGISWKDITTTSATTYTDLKPSPFYRIVSDKISPVIRASCSVAIPLYPNPAKDYVFVQEQSKIINAAGQVVRTGKGLIDIEGLPAGVYVVRAQNKTQKLVVIK